jgi:hypothetical protein
MKLRLHPIYSTDDVPPYHPLWHSAYIGLFYSPELYGFPIPPGMLGGDALAFEGALQYLESIHFISNDAHKSTYEALRDGGYFSRWNGGNPKWTLHDQIIRRLFIRTVVKHPVGMLRLYLVKKPVAIATVIGTLVSRSSPMLIVLTLAGGLCAALFWIVFGDRTELRQAVLFGPIGACAIAFSLLPCEWAYPVSWTVTDGLLLALTVVVVGIGMALAACYNLARPAAS